MYVFGGYNGNTKNHSNTLYRFCLNGSYWQRLYVPGYIPRERRRQACLMYKDKAYLFGGTR